MLQIRLIRDSAAEVGGGGGAKPSAVETVTVACPDHLVLADLPVAKGLGITPSSSVVKSVGRRSRRVPCERVHFCVQCDFPIAIYGRLVLPIETLNITTSIHLLVLFGFDLNLLLGPCLFWIEIHRNWIRRMVINEDEKANFQNCMFVYRIPG